MKWKCIPGFFRRGVVEESLKSHKRFLESFLVVVPQNVWFRCKSRKARQELESDSLPLYFWVLHP